VIDIEQTPLELVKSLVDEGIGCKNRASALEKKLKGKTEEFWADFSRDTAGTRTKLTPAGSRAAARLMLHGYLSSLVLFHVRFGGILPNRIFGEQYFLDLVTPAGRRPENIIGKRLSNALIKDAVADFELFFKVVGLKRLGLLAKPLLNAQLSVFKKLMGGLWVGGTTYLTEDAVIFRPNRMNRLVHKGDCSVSIPLIEITDVKKRFGMVTQIIDITTSKGTLSVRCYRSSSFLEMIREQTQHDSKSQITECRSAD
jgi:hypothetical protein